VLAGKADRSFHFELELKVPSRRMETG
jgi:hypothetical protein